ncbi:MAG: hypothetical protein K2W81_02955 [Sphingomonas sp.]|uniref:hypothetical protein n=1 Tax=Sphingomonas sp. TaxID=28214 RepID=UPI0025D59094|nr:hypothetical protein [Sphingomonas sp.]MBY0282908.1 hypothetical protein [Sphingomonas sp.]
MIKQISAVLLALAATGAVAQSAPGGPLGTLQCTGKPVTIRLSIIKPGQLALFKKAVADHQAWYAKNGNGTKVTLVRVTKRGAGGALSYDDSAAMTVVTYDAKPQPARDAGYAAFVKEYQDSSTVKDEHRGCLG